MVEFAFVAPALFLMFFVSVEFGRAVMLHQVVTEMAGEGCRTTAVSKGSTVEEIDQSIRDGLEVRGVPAGAITSVALEAQPLGGGDFAPITDLSEVRRGQRVRVAIDVDFQAASWIPPVFFPDGTPINAASQMTRE